MEVIPEWLQRVIDEYSTDRYHVEFRRFIYNHLYQGVVALYRLGGTETHIRVFTDWYSKQLEPARTDTKHGSPPTRALLPPTHLKELLGERQEFLELVGHFRQRLVDLGDDLSLLVSEELPPLSASISAKVLHGIIQIGYGYTLNSEREVCEGLAYLHYSYHPHTVSAPGLLTEGLGQGHQTFLHVLRAIPKDTYIMDYMGQGKVVFGDDRDDNPFLVRMATLLARRGDEVVKVVNTIKLPEWFDKSHLDTTQLKRLGGWLLDCAILLYTCCHIKNDSYLLHGVTGSWGLYQVLHTIRNKYHALQAVSYCLSALVAHYIVEGCPALEEEPSLGEAPNMGDVSTPSDGVSPDGWGSLVKRALEGERDEHVYKMVHILQERYRESGEDGHIQGLCLKAAQLAVDNPLNKAQHPPMTHE